jgi:hypothetical protein
MSTTAKSEHLVRFTLSLLVMISVIVGSVTLGLTHPNAVRQTVTAVLSRVGR